MKRKIIIASGIVLGIASYLMLLKQLQKIETLPQASSAEPKTVAIESDDKNHQTKVKVKVEGSSKPSQSEKKNQLRCGLTYADNSNGSIQIYLDSEADGLS